MKRNIIIMCLMLFMTSAHSQQRVKEEIISPVYNTRMSYETSDGELAKALYEKYKSHLVGFKSTLKHTRYRTYVLYFLDFEGVSLREILDYLQQYANSKQNIAR